MELLIRQTHANEYEEIIHLLSSNELPTSDLYEKNIELYVGLLNGEIVATVGMEYYEKCALLRSLSVKEDYKNKKIGETLLQFINDMCQQRSIQFLYLLTTTAEHYFKRFGFDVIDRNDTPPIIQATREFCSICPSSAIIMRKNLAIKE